MGTPQTLYNGGILRATVRYFDTDLQRPGLPPDVAALVDSLGAEYVGVQLVNTSPDEARCLIVQAGAFGEHSFTDVMFEEVNIAYEGLNPNQRARADRSTVKTAERVNGKHFAVNLPPLTSIRLECGLKRFCNDPSYAFPWHGDEVPVL